MKRFLTVGLGALALISLAAVASAQQDGQKRLPAATSVQKAKESASAFAQRPLVLSGSIPMDGVKGRIDHFASGKGRIFVSALANNTVEVLNLFGQVVEHTITG